jgi:hypothetical protein
MQSVFGIFIQIRMVSLVSIYYFVMDNRMIIQVDAKSNLSMF